MTARAMELFLAVVAVLILGADMRAAQATVIEWHLQNVRFDDGGSATGFISLDVDHNGFGPTPGSLPELVDWGIKVRGGDTANFPPFEYTPASTFSSHADGSSLIFFTNQMVPGGDPSQLRMLYLVTNPKMTDAGGKVILDVANDQSRESWNPLPTRSVFGELTAVPEPSNVTFLALGLVMLVVFSARREHGCLTQCLTHCLIII
jgi:hypothetical protein